MIGRNVDVLGCVVGFFVGFVSGVVEVECGV